MSSIRHLLSSKVRSQSGCYTCRLRRKKCDERRPTCQACDALQITCYSGDEKPSWMDGGPKQKEMAESVKALVKKQASQRRDRKYLDILERETRNVSLNSGDEAASTSGPLSKESPKSNTNSQDSSNTPDTAWHSQLFVRDEDDESDIERDAHVHYACIYLDYVFPHLFPLYRPHILVGGRGWLLDVLQSNHKSLYHITISLSAYYFAVILNNGDTIHQACTQKMNNKLQGQIELGLQELQKEVSSLHHRKVESREGLVVMQSMIQLLIFEVATGNREKWKLHLDAATALFCQILTSPDDWTEVLQGLYAYRWPPPGMGVKRPWNTSQAACRFFTANLLYMDVLSSTTLGCAPRLQSYQPAIIPGCAGHAWNPCSITPGPLRMEEFRGLHNWVVQIIGDISALYSWKKAQALAGSLSVDDLVTRGQALSDTIKSGLQTYDVISLPMPDTLVPAPTLDDQPSYGLHNSIWLHAALIYLNTVVSGWKPSSPEIRWCVSKTTELLYSLPKGACLGALAWPFCIAGCLALPEDEPKYREMVSRLGPLQIFGTVTDAMNVMEQVWARRPLDENWDVVQCMNILGHGVLLV